MTNNIQTVRPNDFVLFRQWGTHHEGNCLDPKKWGLPRLVTFTGRVRDVIDFWNTIDGKRYPNGSCIEFTDGTRKEIQFCQILFRGNPDYLQEQEKKKERLPYPKYANVPFSY